MKYSNKLYVCFTMDVERISSESPTGGPPTWEIGEACIQTYCDIVGANGYPATLFIVPDTAEKQSSLFLKLARDGHECGMHFHAQSWQNNYLDPDAHDYLGGYTAEEQYTLLSKALEQSSNALGFKPQCFRPGNVSANDDTFSVLNSLGFTCGSVSQPGRLAPKLKAVWTGAARDVHHTHKAFRLIHGELPFIEVPLAVDSTRTDHWTKVGDLRFEVRDAPDIMRGIEDTLAWQIKNNSIVKHVCLFTHNTPETRLPSIKGVLESLPEIAGKFGLTPCGCTLSSLRENFSALSKTKTQEFSNETKTKIIL